MGGLILLLQERFYIFQGLKAKQHMCSVASGLDSQILGEQEIFGQFKQAAQFFTHTHALNGNLKFLKNMILKYHIFTLQRFIKSFSEHFC